MYAAVRARDEQLLVSTIKETLKILVLQTMENGCV
jgi:hypothetical protein